MGKRCTQITAGDFTASGKGTESFGTKMSIIVIM
jgi:hypothetical protein